MTEAHTLAYVQACAVALNLPLDDERATRVALHLQRTCAMAALLDDVPLGPHDELVEIYRPAPYFPPID
ncbi:DUF4089 domain-containing protein [Hydrogenophaga sp.]|uniref:DUF4089 domain-containing protein n=1 Tax=Hydrogenophaga sp. TaxID=1904254 RepID=UPI0035ADEB8A